MDHGASRGDANSGGAAGDPQPVHAGDETDERPKDSALDHAGDKVDHLDLLKHVVHEDGVRDAEDADRDADGRHHRDDVGYDRQGGHGQNRGEQARDNQEPDGIQRMGLQGFDLFRDDHGADLCSNRGTGEARENDCADERAEFSEDRDADDVGHKISPAEVIERRRELEREDEPDRTGDQRNDEDRADADADDLIHDGVLAQPHAAEQAGVHYPSNGL